MKDSNTALIANIIVILIFALFATGFAYLIYRDCQLDEKTEKIVFDSVYMHGPNCYSFMTNKNKNIVHKQVNSPNISILRDVKIGDAMWYEAIYQVNHYNSSFRGYVQLTIHIHSIDDINTAGWKERRGRGKVTHTGTVERIE